MAINRRQFLIGASGLAAAATAGLAGCAPGSGGGGSQGGQGGGGEGGTVNLALTWWGNPTRNKNTQTMIDTYTKANPNVTIDPQPGEGTGYWDKLATQTAGGQAPDIIQMDMNYIAEYGARGALLDLKDVDVSKFVEGTVDSGKINDTLVGINTGINSGLFFANPKVFEKAKMDLPDDTTWTWDSMIEVGAEVAAKAGVPFGVAGLINSDAMFGTFVRQNGKELFTPDGVAFEPAQAQAWYDWLLKGVKAKAFGTPEQISEEVSKPLDESATVVGRAAIQFWNTNQLEAVSNAAGGDYLMETLRGPSMTGKATDRKTWYKATMLWSASARTENPEAVVAWINWYANSPEAGNIEKAERGIPPNSELLAAVEPNLSPAQKAVAQYIADIKPEVANTPIAPPPGGGTIPEKLQRHGLEVLFGRASSGDAAQKFVDEVKADLQV
jgi:multiple sugar transport system substrate-binding protein